MFVFRNILVYQIIEWDDSNSNSTFFFLLIRLSIAFTQITRLLKNLIFIIVMSFVRTKKHEIQHFFLLNP